MRSDLDRLNAAFDGSLDPRRFRCNLIIDDADAQPTDRHAAGGTIRGIMFGDGPEAPGLRLDEPIQRCAMITIDPLTAARDPAVMRTVAQSFANQVGWYAAPLRCGAIAVGDPVYAADE
jgi:uncharacterized protein YcbX